MYDMNTLIKIKYVAFLYVLSMAVSVSCTKVIDDGDSADTKFEITDDELVVSSDGGQCSVSYVLLNPIEDIVMEFDFQEDWLGAFDVTDNGVIVFEVDENLSGEERRSVVTVLYGALSDSFEVRQQADSNPDPFVVKVDDESIGGRSLIYSVSPADKDMPYVSMIVSKDQFDQFGSEEEYIQDDISYFKTYADAYKMDLAAYLNEYVLCRGDIGPMEIWGLNPNTEYIVYAYGLTSEAEVLTGMYYEQITTVGSDIVDVSFDISAEKTGSTVAVNIVPSDTGIYYLVDVVAKDALGDENTFLGRLQNAINEELLIKGITSEQSLANYVKSKAVTGNYSKSFDVIPEVEYVAYAVAIDKKAVLASELYTESVD